MIELAEPEISVSTLSTDSRFELVTELDHHSLMDFVRVYFQERKSVITIGHSVFSGLVGGVIGATFLLQWDAAGKHIAQFGWGFLATFLLLVPLHEVIHALTYKLCGAQDIRWSYSLKSFAVYVIAHHFVAGRQAFFWVAVAPTFTINALLIAGCFALPDYRMLCLSALFFHTGGTVGDWALVNYFYLRQGDDLYTYDDADFSKSYFYRRR